MARRSSPTSPRGGGISRRDFLNGALLATGGAAVGSFFPMRVLAGPPNLCDGSIDGDPRALRGGNVPAVFNVAHWLRDHRLTFGASSVTLAPDPHGCDTLSGTFPIQDESGRYDVIIVGGGISGLSAAFYIRNRRPHARILILDGNAMFGGNASRDDADPIADISTTGGAYAVVPYADFQTEIYTATGIDWNKNLIPGPFYCYYFDDRTPGAISGARGWNIDSYSESGIRSMPYPPKVIQDLLAARLDFINWANTTGAPTDPADNGDPQFDYLSEMTLADYLTKVKGFDQAVADFYTQYAIDALSGTCAQVNAYSSISFLGAEYGPLFTFPGGTSGLARHIARWLVPTALPRSEPQLISIHNSDIRLEDLDNPANEVRIRQGAMALNGVNSTDGQSASVIYHRGDGFHRATAKAVIFAGQGHTASFCITEMPATQRSAFVTGFTLAPVVVANVTIQRAAPLIDLGLGYDEYWWGSKYWADFTPANWVDAGHRHNRNRPVTLSVFGGNTAPPEQMFNERLKLLSTPFSDYEQSLREDLNRVLGAGGFDFDRDVTSVFLYRWGHSQVYPKVGFPFGPVQAGGTDRSRSARHIFRQQVGRISIAGQDSESTPAVESALGSGLRTALEVLPLL